MSEQENRAGVSDKISVHISVEELAELKKFTDLMDWVVGFIKRMPLQSVLAMVQETDITKYSNNLSEWKERVISVRSEIQVAMDVVTFGTKVCRSHLELLTESHKFLASMESKGLENRLKDFVETLERLEGLKNRGVLDIVKGLTKNDDSKTVL